MCVIEWLSRATRAMADAETIFVMLWLVTLCPPEVFLLMRGFIEVSLRLIEAPPWAARYSTWLLITLTPKGVPYCL